jgi:hypothetical protein
MYVGRRYLAALGVVVLATVAVLVVPRIAHAIHERNVNAEIRAAGQAHSLALKRLRVPDTFSPIRSGPLLADCFGARCYLVHKSPRAVAATIGAIVRGVGITDVSHHGSCSSTGSTCEFSLPVGPPSFTESFDVWIDQLSQCESLTPRRGCKPANASMVTFS